MQEYNFGSVKAIKYFLKNYSIILELKQKGNRDALELLTDFESLLGNIKSSKIIEQYIEIESGGLSVPDKIKYFGKSPLEIISSKTRMSKEKVDELFLKEICDIVVVNGEEEFEYELPIYIYKDDDKKKVNNNQELTDEIVKLKNIDKELRKKIKEESDPKQKKHFINMKKQNYELILEQYEKENIDYNYKKRNIKDERVIYKDYVDNICSEPEIIDINAVEKINYIAKNVLSVDEYKTFSLYYIVNYTQQEIAEIMTVDQGTISRQIKKINKKIRKMLDNQNV